MTTHRQLHGGLDPGELRALGLDPARVLDFSASVNPLGPPPGLWRALRRVDASAYPDRRCLELTEALAGRLGVEPARVLCGNGSTELIHLLARATLDRNRHSLLFAPGFGEYSEAVRASGAAASFVTSQEKDAFRWDLDAAVAAIERRRPALVFAGSPNNPTGVTLTTAEAGRLARALPPGGLLAIDEAYRAFAGHTLETRPLLELGNVVLLRSLTKDHGLAGVRLGYLVGTPAVVERVRSIQPAWSVSALAQAAGLHALRNEGHVAQGRAVVARSKRYLLRALRELGLDALEGNANFLLVKVGDASSLRLRLLRQGIAVRDCTSFGLPQHIRIGVRRPGECRRLVAALREALSNG